MIAALISASVALLVFTLTQWITARRERTKLLLSKLEELYSLVVEYDRRNLARAEILSSLYATGKFKTEGESKDLSHMEWRAKDLNSKLRMYSSFYFPVLDADVQRLFTGNEAMATIVRRRRSSVLTDREIMAAVEPISELVGLLRERIIAERLVLTRDLAAEVKEWLHRYSGGSW